MNICIESNLLNHHQRSGLLTYTEGLVNSLSAYDHSHDYSLVYYSLTRESSQMPGPDKINFKKSVLRMVDQSFYGRQWLVDQILLPTFLKRTKCRIFHRPSGYTMPSGAGIFKVLTVHDLRTLTIGDELWSQNIENYKKAIQGVDVCVVVSECTKKDMIEHLKVDEKKIKVIYLGADNRFKTSSTEDMDRVKRKYGINGPFVLSMGSVPRKNIDGIIQAFAASKIRKDFFLVLTCHLNVDKYRRMIRELGIENNVLILSALNDADVAALYSACHCFIFPSLYEGFGLPILEAMQCGAPVITSNVSSCPEVAGDAAILVDPTNIQEISAAIDQMCQNNSLREGFIQKGAQRSKSFSWERFATEMKKVYELA